MKNVFDLYRIGGEKVCLLDVYPFHTAFALYLTRCAEMTRGRRLTSGFEISQRSIRDIITQQYKRARAHGDAKRKARSRARIQVHENTRKK